MDARSLASLCDDFYVDMYVNTKLDLPGQRDTVLAFFERIQKQFPSLNNFYRGDNRELCLEEDRAIGQYRWVSLEPDCVGSGAVNPPDLEEVYRQDRLVLDLVPYMLGIGVLDVDSLDVSLGMDFVCSGSHDEVIAEALFGSTAFGCLLEVPGAKAVGLSPSIVISLTEDLRTQARISVESKTSVYETPNKKTGPEDAITLSLTIRHFPGSIPQFNALDSFEHQCRWAEDLMTERLVPYFAQPLAAAIAQRGSTG